MVLEIQSIFPQCMIMKHIVDKIMYKREQPRNSIELAAHYGHISISSGMIANALQKWPVVIYVTLAMASPQGPIIRASYQMMGYPEMYSMVQQPDPTMFQYLPPPSMQMPMPVQMPMPIQIIIMPKDRNNKIPQKIKTTTSTPESDEEETSPPKHYKLPPKSHSDKFAVAIPVPIPAPLPPPMPPPPMLAPMPPPHPPPMPLPMPPPLSGPYLPEMRPVQFAIQSTIPEFCRIKTNHPMCPPCPPCSCNPCTPSFLSYCSKCHLKCRCRNIEDVPIPKPPIPPLPLPGMAYPLPVPLPPLPMDNTPEVFVVPFPPQMVKPDNSRKKPRRPHHNCHHKKEKVPDCEQCSDSSSERHDRRFNFFNRGDSILDHDTDMHSDRLVKPVFNFLNERGEVMYRKTLNQKDLSLLINENDSADHEHDTVQDTKRTYKVVNHLEFEENKNKSSTLGTWRRTMVDGKKRLIFMPPQDKIISNLSVTFNINE